VDLDGAYSSAVEHLPYKEGVAGSIPATPTKHQLTCEDTRSGYRHVLSIAVSDPIT
jgi:hypothetical protein